jgi:hypothetical protein
MIWTVLFPPREINKARQSAGQTIQLMSSRSDSSPWCHVQTRGVFVVYQYKDDYFILSRYCKQEQKIYTRDNEDKRRDTERKRERDERDERDEMR